MIFEAAGNDSPGVIRMRKGNQFVSDILMSMHAVSLQLATRMVAYHTWCVEHDRIPAVYIRPYPAKRPWVRRMRIR